jgi:hypothetical protein
VNAWPEGVAARWHTAGGHVFDITDNGHIANVSIEPNDSTADWHIEATADRILTALAE